MPLAAGLAASALLPPGATCLAALSVAPRHMAALANDPARAPRVATMRAALLRSLPVTGLTLLLGGALWQFYPGAAPDRLLALTLQGLAALTPPHLLLDRLASHAEARNTPGITSYLSEYNPGHMIA